MSAGANDILLALDTQRTGAEGAGSGWSRYLDDLRLGNAMNARRIARLAADATGRALPGGCPVAQREGPALEGATGRCPREDGDGVLSAECGVQDGVEVARRHSPASKARAEISTRIAKHASQMSASHVMPPASPA